MNKETTWIVIKTGGTIVVTVVSVTIKVLKEVIKNSKNN